jgi:maleate cis-trans isomerase
MLAYYNDLSELEINANDSNILFQIGNSSFYKSNYLYRIRNESEPYNILIKDVIPANKTSVYGLTILNQNNSSFRILAPYFDNCSLKVSDYFSSRTISGCNNSNITNDSTTLEIHPVRPPFFDSLFSAALLGIVAYAVYLITKKVMSLA